MEMLAARLAEALGEHRRDVATQLWQHRDSTNTVGLAVRRAEEAAFAAQQQAQEAQQALVHVSQMATSGAIDEQSAQYIVADLAALRMSLQTIDREHRELATNERSIATAHAGAPMRPTGHGEHGPPCP
jgi:chemotaxis signal transduction protein